MVETGSTFPARARRAWKIGDPWPREPDSKAHGIEIRTIRAVRSFRLRLLFIFRASFLELIPGRVEVSRFE